MPASKVAGRRRYPSLIDNSSIVLHCLFLAEQIVLTDANTINNAFDLGPSRQSYKANAVFNDRFRTIKLSYPRISRSTYCWLDTKHRITHQRETMDLLPSQGASDFEGKIWPPRPPSKAEIEDIVGDFWDTHIRDQLFKVMSRDELHSWNCLGWAIGKCEFIDDVSYFTNWVNFFRLMAKHGFEPCSREEAAIVVWGQEYVKGRPDIRHFTLKTEGFGWTSKTGFGMLISHERDAFLAREEEDADGDYGYVIGHFKRVKGRPEPTPTVEEVAWRAICDCSTFACINSCVSARGSAERIREGLNQENRLGSK